MLNYYLLGCALAGLIIIHDLIAYDIIQELKDKYPFFDERNMLIGLTLGTLFSMATSWLLVIVRSHKYLMKKF